MAVVLGRWHVFGVSEGDPVDGYRTPPLPSRQGPVLFVRPPRPPRQSAVVLSPSQRFSKCVCGALPWRPRGQNCFHNKPLFAFFTFILL